MLKHYEKALENSGYVYKCQISGEPAYKLKYQKPGKSGRKRKPRNTFYFNPPFSKSVKKKCDKTVPQSD